MKSNDPSTKPLDEPVHRKLVSPGQNYQDAVESLIELLPKNDVILEDGLAEQMVEAAIEKDQEPDAPPMGEQVFLGILASTVH